MASNEYKTRRRSSSRCSRRVMARNGSAGAPATEEVSRSAWGEVSGIGSRRFLGRSGRFLDFYWARGHTTRRSGWRLDLVLLRLQLPDLVFQLTAEVIAGALKLRHSAANLAGNFRQLSRPENKQGQEEEENHLGKAEVHLSIIAAPDCWLPPVPSRHLFS